MNEKFNKNAKVEKFTNMLGIAVRLIFIDPYPQGKISTFTKCYPFSIPLRFSVYLLTKMQLDSLLCVLMVCSLTVSSLPFVASPSHIHTATALRSLRHKQSQRITELVARSQSGSCEIAEWSVIPAIKSITARFLNVFKTCLRRILLQKGPCNVSSGSWLVADYIDDSFIRTHLFPDDIYGLTSFPDYWIAH